MLKYFRMSHSGTKNPQMDPQQHTKKGKGQRNQEEGASNQLSLLSTQWVVLTIIPAHVSPSTHVTFRNTYYQL